MNSKILYLLISIACLASSCNTDSTDDITSTAGMEMAFDVTSISRASDEPPINQFVVYGDAIFTQDGGGVSSPIGIFNRTLVEYKDGSWSYEGTQYWMPKHEHSFVAVAPESALSPANNPRYENSHLTFTYSLPINGGRISSTADIADILIATHRRVYTENASASALDRLISLRFGHILSQINLAPAYNNNITSEDDYITVHELEFNGVKTNGTFDISPAPRQSNSQTDDKVLEINVQDEGNFTLKLPTPIKIGNNATNVSLFADGEALIMLPQTFEPDSEAKITLLFTINEENEIKQVSMPLSNVIWNNGNSYVYKFTIERTGITINSCEITPWNEIDGEEITVD